jgi:hypothetical protein
MAETETLAEEPQAETPPVEAGEEKPPVETPPVKTGKKKDWATPVVIAGGAGILGVGLWLFLSKRGVAAGSKMVAHFTFDYAGTGGTYLLQVSLGHVRLFTFDHVEGLTWTLEVQIDAPGKQEIDFEFELPDFIEPGTYDAEALIRTSAMDWLDYFIKHVAKSAVVVSE